MIRRVFFCFVARVKYPRTSSSPREKINNNTHNTKKKRERKRTTHHTKHHTTTHSHTT